MSRSDRCINLFKKEGEIGHKGKSLFKVPSSILKKFPGIRHNSKICSKCYKQFQKTSKINNTSSEESSDMLMDVDSLDSSIETDDQDSHKPSEVENITLSLREVQLEEMLTDLKEKFASLDTNDPLRLRILTIAPKSWSARQMATEFNISRHLASRAQKLRSEKGVLADTTAKEGKKLPQETEDKVIEFYMNDMNSKMTAGIKDVISIKKGNERKLEQKRLLYLNLKDLYVLCKETYPNITVGFSTFAKLRPKNCILPGGPGTHSVCFCTIHQNIKLILNAIDIENLTKNTDQPLSDYKDCIKEMVCRNSSPNCYLDDCKKCPGTSVILDNLKQLLLHSGISHVKFSMWTSTDRSTLFTQELEVDDYLSELSEKLQTLKPHSFIAKQQSLFITETKENLAENESLVMFDFSENYNYHCQEASQAFHFNNDQCTVFPVICYYKKNGTLMHKSYVFLSDSLKHDTAAVYSVQTILIPELKNLIPNMKKLTYMTDGAKQHFKNKFQISNLRKHEQDFGIEADWHYCVSAHGKSCYDGIGATFKREAYRASLTAKPQDAILTFEALLKWARNHSKQISVLHFNKQYHEKIRRQLKGRFNTAEPVPGISKNHGFVVTPSKSVVIKRYSNAETGIEWS